MAMLFGRIIAGCHTMEASARTSIERPEAQGAADRNK